MVNRTYRYFYGDPLFPFGHGLSYTSFEYDNLKVPDRTPVGENIEVSVDVSNTGMLEGDEVVQLYVSHSDVVDSAPIRSLKGFRRIHLAPGETQTIRFVLEPDVLALADENGAFVQESGTVEITIGGKQPGFSGYANAATTDVVSGSITVEE